MSVTVKKNGAPTYDQGAVVQPEYTYDNWLAQMSWNKEIANNKQGYLAVDIMPMKDFYDAGGYSFVNDYRAELASVDAAYDRAVPGYGVQGEQMAGAGLTGSGFTDYMSGQAYAARVGGQALARQNAMANSNSFRAAYNQYVQQQLQKREDNLLSVVEKAYAAGVPLANFTTIATRLGIPQADAERGYSMLEAYYSGFGTSSQKYPIPDANGSTDSATGSSTATPVGDYTIDKLDTEDAAIAGSYAQQVAQEVQEGMSVEQALNLIKGQYEDYGGVITSAIKNQMNAILTSAIDSKINEGEYVSKELLDTYAARGVFGAEGKESAGYKAMLEKVQGANYGNFSAIFKSDDYEGYESFLAGLGDDYLKSLGIDPETITEENAQEVAGIVRDEMYENGEISEKAYNESYYNEYVRDLKEINTRKDVEQFLVSMVTEKEKLGGMYRELAKKITITSGKNNGLGKVNSTALIIDSGYKDYIVVSDPTVNTKKLDNRLEGVNDGDVITDGKNIYLYQEVDTQNGTAYQVVSYGVSGPMKNVYIDILKAQGKDFSVKAGFKRGTKA